MGWGLIYAGLLVFAFLGYQLFITDLFNNRIQEAAQKTLVSELEERREELPPVESVEVSVPETPDTPDTTMETPTIAIDFVPEEAGEEGATLGRFVIPKIEVDVVMFEGVTAPTLEMGPGHMPGTPVPGQPGNAVISGHRTTHGRPFYDLDELVEGDTIEIETAAGRHVYAVRRKLIVEPTDVFVTEPIPGAWLTLTTCHPQFSAAERLIIQAELIEGPNLRYADLLKDEPQQEAT